MNTELIEASQKAADFLRELGMGGEIVRRLELAIKKATKGQLRPDNEKKPNKGAFSYSELLKEYLVV